MWNFKVVDHREDKQIKAHTKEGMEKMVVKIPDPISWTSPSAESTSLPTIPSGEALKFATDTPTVQVPSKNSLIKQRQHHNSDVLSQIKISGDKDLFSNESRSASAKMPEFTLGIQTEKWEVAKNRAPLRSQSAQKQTAHLSTMETLVRQGTITNSESPYYSQVLLVPKPDNTFRM